MISLCLICCVTFHWLSCLLNYKSRNRSQGLTQLWALTEKYFEWKMHFDFEYGSAANTRACVSLSCSYLRPSSLSAPNVSILMDTSTQLQRRRHASLSYIHLSVDLKNTEIPQANIIIYYNVRLYFTSIFVWLLLFIFKYILLYRIIQTPFAALDAEIIYSIKSSSVCWK